MRSVSKALIAGKLHPVQPFVSLLFFLVLLHGISGISRAVQTVDYEKVIDKALLNSHDVRMSKLDIAISRSSLKGAYALYYPSIATHWNTEYAEDLTNGTSQFAVIGNTVLAQDTAYRSSFSFTGNYNLYDFGVTAGKVFIARTGVDVKLSTYRQAVRDIRLKVLKIYSDLLTSCEELETKKELLSLYKELSLTKERLFAAGAVSRIDVADEAIKTVKIIDDIDNLKLKVRSSLEDLTFFTGDRYDSDALRVSQFAETGDVPESTFDPYRTPESRIYDLEIEKKKAEIGVLQRGLLPQFSAHSSYAFYASHPSRIGASQYVKPRNFTIGLTVTMPLFEGFKSPAEIEKATFELERLKVEKSRKMTELSNRYAKLNEAYKTSIKNVANQKDMLAGVEGNLVMSGRLVGQKTIEWTEFLTRKIDLTNQRHELTKTMITRTAGIKEMRILAESGE